MILIILVLTTYDSLPPLPDLSKSSFPEPGLLPIRSKDAIRFTGYAGQSFGADIEFYFRDLSVDATYTRANEWDSTDLGGASLSYAIFAPNIWIKPSIAADLVERRDKYRNISPGIEYNIFLHSLVAAGALEYNHWQLNDEAVREASGRVSLTFDRLSYTPQLEMSSIYSGQRARPSLRTQVNVGSFHLWLGSLVNSGFPSPRLSITYAVPCFNISTGFKSGTQYSTLMSIFDPDLPFRYPTSIPAETLSLAADVAFEVKFSNHHFRLSGSYKEWLSRLNTGSDYMPTQISDVRESNLELSARNIVRFGTIRISNWLHLTYNNSDSALAFIPDYTAADSMAVAVGMVELTADARFISKRAGLERSLPSYYTINTTFGLRLSFVKLYIAINNITDDKSEIYDTYFMTGRKYAVGVVLDHRL